MMFEVSAGRAVTPQEGQIGARPTLALSPSLRLVIIPGEARSAWICLEGVRVPHIAGPVSAAVAAPDESEQLVAMSIELDAEVADVLPVSLVGHFLRRERLQ